MAILSSGRCGCYRCAFVWTPRNPKLPGLCPRCKSRLWDVPELRPIRVGRGRGIPEILQPHRREVLAAAATHGFEHVRVFGSVRRQEATPRSDVALLVHARPGTSLLDQAALEIDLERILQRHVDVVPDEALHWLLRPQVLFEAVSL